MESSNALNSKIGSENMNSIIKQCEENTEGLTVNTEILRSSSTNLVKGGEILANFSRLPVSKPCGRITHRPLLR